MMLQELRDALSEVASICENSGESTEVVFRLAGTEDEYDLEVVRLEGTANFQTERGTLCEFPGWAETITIVLRKV